MIIVSGVDAWDDIPENAIHSVWDVDRIHSWNKDGTVIQLEGDDKYYSLIINTGDMDNQ
jgi:hypothetical protein